MHTHWSVQAGNRILAGTSWLHCQISNLTLDSHAGMHAHTHTHTVSLRHYYVHDTMSRPIKRTASEL